jgi:ubiquitin C
MDENFITCNYCGTGFSDWLVESRRCTLCGEKMDGTIKVVVKMLSFHPAEELTLTCKGTDTIGSLKVQIAEVHGRGASFLRLLFDQENLKDDVTLHDLSFKDNWVLSCLESKVSAKKRPESGHQKLVLTENPHQQKRVKGSLQQFLETKEEPTAVSSKSFRIFISPINGNTFTLDVEAKETVASLQSRVEKKIGKKPGQLKLLRNSVELELNNARLSDFGIERFDNITAVWSTSFQLYVNVNFGAEFIVFDVEESDTIDSVKAKIQDKKGIPVSQQLLRLKEYVGRRVHIGMALAGDSKLSDYGIKDGNHEIMLVV